MSIGGSDNSGGAGIQADLKTFMAHSCYGLSVVTAITAQNTVEFATYQTISANLVLEQIKMSIRQCTPLSIKTGMLATAENISAVNQAIEEYNLQMLIIDPVLKSSTNITLMTNDNNDYLKMLQDILIPRSFAVTPNKYEAEILSGINIESYDDAKKSAKIIYDMGARNVIIKGGHMDFDKHESIDILFTGKEWKQYSVKKLNMGSFHGTGCTFSAAVCASLARGLTMDAAVNCAKRYTLQTMENQLYKTPSGILNHNVNSFIQ